MRNGLSGAFIGLYTALVILKFHKVIKFSVFSFLIFFFTSFFVYWIFDTLFGNLAVLRLHMEAYQAYIVLGVLTLVLWGVMGYFFALMSSGEIQKKSLRFWDNNGK